MVRRTGPTHNVLSTDLGQPHGLFPVEGMAAMIQRYADGGFSPTDIRQMTVVNPGALLH